MAVAPRGERRKGRGAVALVLAFLGWPSLAMAETQTGQLTVSATVQSGCTLTGGTLDFGSYVSGQAADLDASGQIGFVNCTGVLTFELDGGQQGNVNARRMTGAGGMLAYQLYRTSARAAVWGTGGNAHQLQLVGTVPTSGAVTVHGRIPGSQSVPAGGYADIVNITLTF